MQQVLRSRADLFERRTLAPRAAADVVEATEFFRRRAGLSQVGRVVVYEGEKPQVCLHSLDGVRAVS